MSLTYTNPVHDGYFADPFVMEAPQSGSRYVAIGTGSTRDDRAFEVLRSDDLITWRSAGGALVRPEGCGSDYWAPEVAEHDGRWWMYYSCGEGDRGHSLRVAVADSPVGPYVDQGVDLTPDERFAIDPHPFRDADGSWYLFFAKDVLEGERVGTMLAVDRLETMTRLAGQARTILTPSADWQVFLREREMYGQTYDWHTLEGPFVRRHAGRYWCFYSGGSWMEPTYGVGVAVADSPLGPWQEHGEPGGGPIMRTVPGHVLGPGHNSVVRGPHGQDVVVYHAWDADQTARRMCIDPLRWTDDGPVVDAPTWTEVDLERDVAVRQD
jgi:arabinan endo-1,5-alpha-L-arabinosidase